MYTRRITIEADQHALEFLVFLAQKAQEAVRAGETQEALGNGCARIHPAKSASVDVVALLAEFNKGRSRESYSSPRSVERAGDAAREVEFAMAYTRKCEAEAAAAANKAASPESKGVGLNVYTRAQVVASFSSHGSFGRDAETRQCAKQGGEQFRFGYGVGRECNSPFGRPVEVTSHIFCG